MPLGGLGTAGMIVGGLGAVGKSIFGISQMGEANKINPQWSQYQKNPLAEQNLGAVKNLYYGKSPAFTQAEANIRQAQANQMSNASRGATDSSTLLATGAGAEAQTQNALSGISAQEANQKVGVLDNLSRAYAMAISEGDKEQANKLMKYQLDTQYQAQLGASGAQNLFGGIGDIAGGMMQYGNYSNAANMNKILAKKYNVDI